MAKKVPHHKNKTPDSELSKIEPVPTKDLTFDKLHTYSSKKLLVTAIALNKKAKRQKNPQVAQAMNVLALGIKQILDGRMNIKAGNVA